MKITKVLVALPSLCLLPLLGYAECASVANVVVDEAAMTVEPKDVRVCQGGSVEWTSAGPTRFQVVFSGKRPGNETKSDPLHVIVEATSEKGSYPYDVLIQGERLDPTIIIE